MEKSSAKDSPTISSDTRAVDRSAVSFAAIPFEETFLAKPNYSFEKRQREIARKKKQDEKRQRKVQRAPDEPAPADQQTQPTPPETGTAA